MIRIGSRHTDRAREAIAHAGETLVRDHGLAGSQLKGLHHHGEGATAAARHDVITGFREPGENFHHVKGIEEAFRGEIAGFGERQERTHLLAEGQPITMIAEGVLQQRRQEATGIGLEAGGQVWIGLGQLSGVDVDLDHLAEGHELAPIEAGLLQTQPGPHGQHQIGLLKDQVAGTLPPGIRTARIVGVIRRVAIGSIPGGHDRQVQGRELRLQGAGLAM